MGGMSAIEGCAVFMPLGEEIIAHPPIKAAQQMKSRCNQAALVFENWSEKKVITILDGENIEAFYHLAMTCP